MLISCNGGSDSLPNTDWTYMVYIAGDNNLSSAAIGDLNEMEKVGSNEKLNIIVQAEFSQQFSENMPSATLRYRIMQDNDTQKITTPSTEVVTTVDGTDTNNQNMGDKNTLTDFIKWTTTNYPAKRYMLVLWDHGSGWKFSRIKGGAIKGALEDTTSDSYMSLPDIATAVRDSGVHMDIINFDACLMGMYEVAYEFNGLTDYMVFSEEVEPGEGDPYDTILKKLKNDSSMSSETLAKTITSDFKTFYENKPRTYITKSAIDMSYIIEFHDLIKEFSNLLTQNMDTERPSIQVARSQSIKYEFPENHDIGSFLKHLDERTSNDDIKSKIAQIQNSMTNLIISNETYSSEPNSNIETIVDSTGLAIFLPQRDQVTNTDLSNYANLAINQTNRAEEGTWINFVNLLVTGDEDGGQVALETGEGNFVIALEWNNPNIDLDLIILQPDLTFAAPYIGATSSNGFLSEDSTSSGEPKEYFAAAEKVQAGDYDIFVHYHNDDNIPEGDSTNASITILSDESEVIGTFQKYMSLEAPFLNNPFSDENELTNIANNLYTNWWTPISLEIRPEQENIIKNFEIESKKFHVLKLPNKTKIKPNLNRQ